MSHATMPHAIDLERILFAGGMFDSPQTIQQQIIDLDSAIRGAVTMWESGTGYDPFLAATQTRVFDPPGPTIRGTRYGYRARGGERRVSFDNGLWTLTSITTGVDAVSTGTVRTLGTDFFLLPVNAPQRGEPYTSAEFVLPIWGNLQSVHIVGSWGFTSTVPDDAWNAILGMAAYTVLPQLVHSLTGGVAEYREEDEYKKFTVNPFKAQGDAWKMAFDKAVLSYLLL